MQNSSLEITDLKIYPQHKESSNVRAFCVVTFNNALIVSGIRIKEGEKGIYIAFPLNKTGDKQFPVVYPATGDARKEISNRILATYVVNYCIEDFAD